MFEELQIINDIVKEFLIIIILGIAGLISAFIRRKYNATGKKLDVFIKDNTERMDKMQGCLDNQNDRGIRQSKAQIDLAEHMDDETERLHPNKKVNKIKKRIMRNLLDENDNL